MPPPPDALAVRLVEALQSAAMYNDKGFIWRNDSAEQIGEHRLRFQTTFDGLARDLGRDALGPELAAAIASGVAALDGSGRIVDLARQRFQRVG